MLCSCLLKLVVIKTNIFLVLSEQIRGLDIIFGLSSCFASSGCASRRSLTGRTSCVDEEDSAGLQEANGKRTENYRTGGLLTDFQLNNQPKTTELCVNHKNQQAQL